MYVKDKGGDFQGPGWLLGVFRRGTATPEVSATEIDVQTESQASSGAFYRSSRISTIVRLRICPCLDGPTSIPVGLARTCGGLVRGDERAKLWLPV